MCAATMPAAVVVARGLDRRLGLADVDVGHRDVGVRRPLRGDRHERRPDTACTDHEDSHAVAM
jgi:hypothetical protein